MTQPERRRGVLDNLRRHEAGEPMVGLVDRARGY
jgi:glyoxylate/hydroxypyruvate reductase A